MKLYHVGPENLTNIESLYNQMGEDAYEVFEERWPEAAELGIYHAHYIHLWDVLEDARDFADEIGGTVYEVEADGLDVEIDELEYPHPIIRDEIPAEYVMAI